MKRHGKKSIGIVAAIFLILLGIGMIDSPTLKSLTLDSPEQIQLDISETKTIPIKVEEDRADTGNLRFFVSGDPVVTFRKRESGTELSGLVTPTAEGTAEIYVSSRDVESNHITVTVTDTARIAAEEAAKKAAEEEAARKAAEEAAAKKAAEEEAARKAAEEEAARKAAEEEAAKKAEAEAAAAQKAQEQAAQQPQEQMVWIPKSGKCYHYNSSCSKMKNPTQVTISQAIKRGYKACSKCT